MAYTRILACLFGVILQLDSIIRQRVSKVSELINCNRVSTYFNENYRFVIVYTQNIGNDNANINELFDYVNVIGLYKGVTLRIRINRHV